LHVVGDVHLERVPGARVLSDMLAVKPHYSVVTDAIEAQPEAPARHLLRRGHLSPEHERSRSVLGDAGLLPTARDGDGKLARAVHQRPGAVEGEPHPWVCGACASCGCATSCSTGSGPPLRTELLIASSVAIVLKP